MGRCSAGIQGRKGPDSFCRDHISIRSKLPINSTILFAPVGNITGMDAKDLEKKPTTTSPSVGPDGSINPSAPTAGTEGYGMQKGEPGNEDVSASESHPNNRGAGDVRRTSYPHPEGSHLMENKSRQDELRDNPNNRMGKSLSCSDVGNMSCNWSVVGEHEDEIMRRAEEHARDAHGITSFDESTRKRVHDAIRNRAA